MAVGARDMGESLGEKLAKILGLESENVRSISLVCEPDSVPYAKVETYIDEKQEAAMLETIEADMPIEVVREPVSDIAIGPTTFHMERTGGVVVEGGHRYIGDVTVEWLRYRNQGCAKCSKAFADGQLLYWDDVGQGLVCNDCTRRTNA